MVKKENAKVSKKRENNEIEKIIDDLILEYDDSNNYFTKVAVL